MFCGHPTYRPDICKELVDMFADGSTITQVCSRKLKIARSTFYYWRENYPEFDAAANMAIEASQSTHEEIMMDGIMGKIKGYQANPHIFLMKSTFKGEYTEKLDDKTEAIMQALAASINDKAAKKEPNA